jgi:hypothetical protein
VAVAIPPPEVTSRGSGAPDTEMRVTGFTSIAIRWLAAAFCADAPEPHMSDITATMNNILHEVFIPHAPSSGTP